MIGNTGEQLFHTWRSFHFDKKYGDDRHLQTLYKTGCHTHRLLETANTRGLQKYPSYITKLGSFLNSRLRTGSRDSKENLNKREIR